MDKREFMNSVKNGALKGYADYGILPSLTISQAILESGWGSSQLSVRVKNLFGIKAFSDWRAERITLPTTEWYNEKLRVINADFRAYASFNESVEDHNRLLANDRYKPVRECADYRDACRKIYDCGYATDPEYPEKLIKIIEEKLCNSLGVKDYEKRALDEDNELGPRTRSCIDKIPMLKEGSRGEAVSFVQELIKAVSVDGDFGPITKNCVMKYQRTKNIEVDGIVGPQTWTALVTT